MLKNVLLCLSLASLAVEIFGTFSCDEICNPGDKLEVNEPVCGSDGNTYSTRCALKTAVCKSKKVVSIVHYGNCKYSGLDCISKIPCYLDKAQICASDGNPYYNECAMRKHACKEKTAKVGVKLGTDCSSCPTCIGVSQEKVCGSDHKTYNSMCELRAEACKQKQAIIVLKNGACETTGNVWGFKRDMANSDSRENVRRFMEDEDPRFPDEEEDEDDTDAHENDDED